MLPEPDRASRPGLSALLGEVRLRLVGCDATFELPGPTQSAPPRHPLTTEVGWPGAVVGRGDQADVRVVGPASERVSRCHLRLETVGRRWRARDLETLNGTWERDDAGELERLPTDVGIPLADGMRLVLGEDLLIEFELVPTAATGTATPGRRGGAPRGGREERIADAKLERFAAALLRERRIDPRKQTVRPVEQVGGELYISRATAYAWLKKLAALPEVAASAPSGEAQDVADALAQHYPYLVDG